VVKEVTAEGDIVLFIDEIHTLVVLRWRRCYGCSKYFETSFGSWRTARYWCNHLDEYKKYFEKALERRFQKIIIEEPDTESAISILRGIKEKYETHHKVQIKDEAIIAAVELSQRYITNRFLPESY
jgi:ATP-dependent Clp protease ATP-binding subunit ClpB